MESMSNEKFHRRIYVPSGSAPVSDNVCEHRNRLVDAVLRGERITKTQEQLDADEREAKKKASKRKSSRLQALQDYEE
jgi:hypothetical protein